MKTSLDCIPCFLSQSLEASRMVSDDREVHEKVLKKVMNYLQNISFDFPPPFVSRRVHEIIRREVGSKDPYKTAKEKSNIVARGYYEKLNKIVDESQDPFICSLKVAIAGNAIDFGTMNRIGIDEAIERVLNSELDSSTCERLRKDIERAESILYLADNAGETYFDKVLLAQLEGKEITYVVKANPIINDATVEDALLAGIDEHAEILAGDEGQESSAPAIILDYSSERFRKKFWDADVVIAKGQGNYEALSEVNRKIYFLLMAKCRLVAEDLGCEVGCPVIKLKGEGDDTLHSKR